jgi:hypothetical protein
MIQDQSEGEGQGQTRSAQEDRSDQGSAPGDRPLADLR